MLKVKGKLISEYIAYLFLTKKNINKHQVWLFLMFLSPPLLTHTFNGFLQIKRQKNI